MKVGGLAAMALSLVACAGPSSAPRPVAQGPITDDAPVDAGSTQGEAGRSTKEAKAIARTLLKVADIRGIQPTRDVPGVRLTREELVARVKEKALREFPTEALRREGQLLQLLGFAPATFDYLGEMMHLLEAQLEGFYEPKNGTMYLASDLRGTQAQATLAHELVHALQDQRWDLKTRSTYRPGRGDETLALAALAEGDATSAMMDFVMADQGGRTALDLPDDLLRELMKSGIGMAEVEAVPHILRTTLVAPYIEGIAFVNGLRRKGGWPLVDRAWARPPVSTEQVLHVDKWESDERPVALPAPSAQTLGPEWKLDDEDTFGELGFALTFAEWMDAEDARALAMGWGGDRSSVFTKSGAIAFAVHSRYDKTKPVTALADRAFAKLSAALQKQLGRAATADATTTCFDRKELGPLLLAKRDRDLVLVAGPARPGKDRWSSEGSCPTARKWASEILSQK
jgi:hypothetical protein